MGLEVSHAADLNVRVRTTLSGEGLPFSLDVEFVAYAGFTMLFGASGSGKTTLLDCIAGLRKPTSGRITVGAMTLFDSTERVDLPPSRRGVGYLLQSLALFPHLSVQQNVQYGLADLSSVERDARARQILDLFRIGHLAQRRPAELSGGERQRAALARTLVTQPRVLLLDEPLTALDALTKSQILDDLRVWNREHQIPILYVTHHRDELFALGERVIAIRTGRIVAQGSPHEVLQRPELESVAQLAGFENILAASFAAPHPDQGTMTCRIGNATLTLEVPFTRIEQACPLRIGIRAGDILVATSRPEGLSARNIFPGTISSLQRRDVMMIARVNCGVDLEVHLTPGATESLQLNVGGSVWLVVKTYSCQVMQERDRGSEVRVQI
jgi:molybdate transport system ATP-binding protein